MEAESGLFRSYARLIVSSPAWVVLVLLGVTVFLGMRVGSLMIDMNPDLWAPQSHPYIQTTNEIEKIFGGRNYTLIGIVPKQGDVYQPEVLAKIQRIQRGIEELPQAVRHNVTSLAARKVKRITGTADGMEVRQMMETVPRTPADIAQLKAAVASLPIYINALVSADGKAAAVVADFKMDNANPSYTPILEAIHSVVDRERDGTVDIYLGGQPVSIAWFEFHLMKMPIFFGLALLLVMIIQYWSFRSFQGMFLPMLTAILSVVWGLGLMGLLGVHMDPMNTTTPILVMAVAAGHGIQILKRYYEEYHCLKDRSLSPREASRAAVVESLVRVGPVMLTAGLIAIITFYSLAATGIAMVRHFGVFAGSGVLGAMILELTLIPAVRVLLPAPKRAETESERRVGILDRFLLWVARNLVGGRAPWIVGTGLALLAVAACGLTFLRVDNRVKEYHRPTSEFRVHDDVLNQRFGGTNSILFLIEAPRQDGIKDPKVLQGIDALQGFLGTQPLVGKTQSIVDLLKRMNQAMHADRPDAYALPDRQDLVAQYLFLYSLSGDPQDFDSYVDNDYQRAAVWAYLKTDSSAYADALYNKARGVIAKSFPADVSVRMGGSLPQMMATNEVVTQDKFRNMAQMVVVVFALSALVLRSVVGGLFVVTPVVAVILANFGLMGWLGMPLDIGAATAAAMAVGIGADYEIYLLFRFREELARSGNILTATHESLQTSGKAIIFVALSIIGGYAVLQFSGFGWYNQISTLVMATMAISAFFALFFLRSMMMIFKPRFIFGERRELLFAQAASATHGGVK
jgi:predicted RND superfamily exporter protein